MSVGKNLLQVLKQVSSVAVECGRDPQAVRLLAVSKTHSSQKILAAYQEGQRSFAENYVQEALEKMEQLSSQKIEWHFIGRVQSNKVKQIVGRFALIHSVDRISLAEEISKRAVEQKIIQPILLQVNIGEEVTKGGVNASELIALAQSAKAMKGIRVEGLMTMPPLSSTPAEAHGYFKKTRELFEQLQRSLPMKELSMGTSSDYKAAIQEGATLIRVGTDIFGPREDKP